MPPRTAPLFPVAKAMGKAAAALLLGIGVYAAVEFLSVIHFPPIMFIMEYDEQLYARLTPPPPVTRADLHPVILVEVNDATLSDAGLKPGDRTPRSVLAGIIDFASRNHAAAIFVDIDLRDAAPDDDRLRQAIQEATRHSGTPVLVPQLVDSRSFPTCLTGPLRGEGVLPALLPLAVGGDTPVIPVHGYFEPGWMGTAQAVCSAYPIGPYGNGAYTRLPAAMWEAVDISPGMPCHSAAAAANEPSADQPFANLEPITWRLNNHTTAVPFGVPPRWAFLRKPANLLKEPGTNWDTPQPAKNVDVSAFVCAIVIIGATGSGSSDLVSTPIGEMPGALAHANLALSLQDPYSEGPVARLAFDFLFLVLAPAVTAMVCWWPLFRANKGDGTGSRMLRTVLELLVTLLLWFCLCLFVILSAPLHGGARFGLLSGLVSIGIVFLSAILQPFADKAEHIAGGWWQALLQCPHCNAAAPPARSDDPGGGE
jgi:CHASE2 domain-containing sensor protein